MPPTNRLRLRAALFSSENAQWQVTLGNQWPQWLVSKYVYPCKLKIIKQKNQAIFISSCHWMTDFCRILLKEFLDFQTKLVPNWKLLNYQLKKNSITDISAIKQASHCLWLPCHTKAKLTLPHEYLFYTKSYVPQVWSKLSESSPPVRGKKKKKRFLH